LRCLLLLALKADDEGTDPEKLIYEIYQATARMKAHLTADHLLLINQLVEFYKKVPEQTLEKIKKEVSMELVETTISNIFSISAKSKEKPKASSKDSLRFWKICIGRAFYLKNRLNT